MFEWHGNGGSTISSCHGIFAVYSQKTSWAPGLTFQASGARDQLQTIEFRVWIGPDMTMTTCDHPSKSTDAKNKWQLFSIQSSPWRGNEACHADEGAYLFLGRDGHPKTCGDTFDDAQAKRSWHLMIPLRRRERHQNIRLSTTHGPIAASTISGASALILWVILIASAPIPAKAPTGMISCG